MLSQPGGIIFEHFFGKMLLKLAKKCTITKIPYFQLSVALCGRYRRQGN
jgi:hypothetical protein